VHDERAVLERRIARELWERVLPLVERDRRPLSVTAGADRVHQTPFAVGDRWGAPWATTWFVLRGEIPAAWAGRRVEAVIDLGFHRDAAGFQCEGLVVDPGGRPVQGVHPRRTNVAVAAEPGPVEIVVEAASNPSFPQFRPSPLGDPVTAGDALLYRFARAELVLVDGEAEALAHDVDVLDALMRTLAADDPRRARLLATIVRALDAVPDVGAARSILEPALSQPARASAHQVVAIGHAHLDTAWLWPMRETVRKCARTFASALRLMDDYPEYRFACSQAQHYAWIEEHHPDLFDRIRTKVRHGQWIPVGGMWVEADMNLPSGESLVRQIVVGQRWFESRLGVRCTEVWIPDVFGYPAGLPQLFALGGMSRFVTQKLSWNKHNRFPHHTFWWEGLDGTQVLAHFPPVDTYNAEVTPAELAHASRSFREHGWSDWSLMPFGHGDGGGGPTREMLERARRLADLDGAPAVSIDSPAAFFERVEREIADGAPVPVWRGELYFETHRGTLTSQLRTKVGNRRCERLLREVELWAATAGVAAGVDDQWHAVLTQQFHDILPGSSIAWVHRDAGAVHARVASELEARLTTLLRSLAPPGVAVANAAGVDRDEIVAVAEAPAGDGSVQKLADGRHACRVVVPAHGIVALGALEADDAVVVTERSMANRHLAVRWDLDGNLTSIIDVGRAREVIPPGVLGAVLELAVDQPVEYDAWDVERWTRAGGVPLLAAESVALVEHGPLVGRVEVTRRVGAASTAVVAYELRAGSPRLDAHVTIDWHEHERLLSIVFPIDVRTDVAMCDVQFGAVARPTHASTSWDAAKFEVCAHRFVDLAEPLFGVAVLNDARYGHGVFDGAVRVSLARGARYPDPEADQGRHEVTLAVMPHGPGRASVVSAAAALNLPLRVVTDGAADEAPAPLLTVTGSGVEVDAVKLADDGSGDVVVRCHEACGDRAAVTVRTPWRIMAASRCNLLEETLAGLEVSDGIAALVLRPYEIVTLRLSR
jgi:alpha-mannosidase